ncbi:hypothetical protein HK102_004575 [Quaeritorhiza haematococci]|nr:hypothetical protein HK102_004575 [Quaeritorhiza haematococci]
MLFILTAEPALSSQPRTFRYPELLDEGYASDFPDDFPFWYAGASGLQHIQLLKTPSSTTSNIQLDGAEEVEQGETDETEGEVGSDEERAYTEAEYSNRKDSVLRYFVKTGDNEVALDKYLNGLIQTFLDEPSRVFASTTDTDEAIRSKFGQTFVPEGCSNAAEVEAYLRMLKTNVIDQATRVASPKMIGHMTTALPYFHRPLARLLAALNQNVVKLETASTTTFLERETIAMLHREFFLHPASFYSSFMHDPESCLGVFCSGGTIANITAMWIARNTALGPKEGFGGIEKEGLFRAMRAYGYEGAVIVGSRLVHYSMKKAADLLGLGDEGLVTIPVDQNFQIRMDLLKRKLDELVASKILPIAIIGIASATETGSIDPLQEMSTLARSYNIHFHVDAAWGGPLIFSQSHKSKLTGIEHADSITIDGHKQLYTPMGLGLLLLRSPQSATRIRKTANYIIRSNSPDLGKFTLEGSRPASSLHLHASLHLLGRDGLEVLTTRSVTLVRQLANRLRTHPEGAFWVVHEPMSNILVYRYIPRALRPFFKLAMLGASCCGGDGSPGNIFTREQEDHINEITRRLQIRQSKEGSQGFVSRTRVPHPYPPRETSPLYSFTNDSTATTSSQHMDIDVLRVVIANPLTQWEDIQECIAEQLALGEVVEDEYVVEREEKEKEKWWVGWPFEI